MDYNYSYDIPSFSNFFGQSPTDLLSVLAGYKNDMLGRKYGHENELQSNQLKEAGRQFDVGTNFGREQEGNKYRYLDSLLSFDRDKQAQAVRDAQLARGMQLRNAIQPGSIGNVPIDRGNPGANAPVWSFTSGYNSR